MALGLGRQRLQVLFWALIIAGLPLAIILNLWLSASEFGAPAGDQPGGVLRVRVVDEQGDGVAGHPVELQLWPSGGEARTHETRASDDEGRIAFEAPPLQGKYRLLAGGGEQQRVGRERSFVDGRGRPVELSEVQLELRPAASIAMEFTRTEGPPVRGGELWLTATTRGGPFFGLLGTVVALEEEFEGATCVLDGLPPLDGKVRVRFLDGTELEFEVGAPVGRTTLAYEL